MGLFSTIVLGVASAVFGWSDTARNRFEMNTRKDYEAFRARLENQRMELQDQISEREQQRKIALLKITNEEKQKMIEKQYEIDKAWFEFQTDTALKLTQIITELQIKHASKILELVSGYRKQQYLSVQEVMINHRKEIRRIEKEAFKYQEKSPQLFEFKLRQLNDVQTIFIKLASELTNEIGNDIRKVQDWLLNRIGPEEFLLKLTGSKDGVESFKRYLQIEGIKDIEEIKDKYIEDQEANYVI